MGTQIASQLTAQRQDIIDALVLDSPMVSFTEIAVASMPKEQAPMIRSFLKSPYSAKTAVEMIKEIPVLVMHSKTDKAVPYIQGQEVFESVGSPLKYFWTYTGEHLDAPSLHPDELIGKMRLLFSQKHR